jgi:DNA-binding Xre family transcriptional regulator
MAVAYTKLWKLLLDKKLKRTDMKEIAGISSSTLAKLGKDEYVSMECMDRICAALKCDIGDIMSFSREER